MVWLAGLVGRTGLALRVSVLAGAVLIATATATGYVGAREQRRALLGQLEQHAGHLADVLATLGAEALDGGSAAELEGVVAAVARDPQVQLVEVRDRAARVVAAGGARTQRDGLAWATREVRAGGAVVGAVVLGLSPDGARSGAAAWRLLAVPATAGLGLLFGLIFLLVRQAISTPLARIARAMGEVAEAAGSLTGRIDASGPGEIGELARQFNRMADHLHGSHEDLARQVAETAAKNAELDAFVYSVAHDLKAPLLTIRGFCELLREHAGPRLDAADLRCLGRLEINVGRLERLIVDLLAFARIGRDKPSPEHVNVSELIDDLQLDMRELIRARGVTIALRGVGAIWAARSRIEQVFRNLLSNAIKYAGETPIPTVEIGMCSRDDMWECYVRDNGIGIDPTYHETIFEIFQRLQDVEVEGTGVGLAIVKKVVEQAGGRVWVESAVGKGSTFYFTWPKAGDPALAPEATA